VKEKLIWDTTLDPIEYPSQIKEKFFKLSIKHRKDFVNWIGKISNDFINKAWICSTTYLVLSHIIDIQYFDIRISLASWILLAGIKCSFSEASQKIS